MSLKIRLAIDINYDLNGESIQSITENLEHLAYNAVGNGLLTGNTAAEVADYQIKVAELPANVSESATPADLLAVGIQMTTLAKFLAMLKLSTAVTLDDGAMLTNWTLAEQSGAAENQIARFTWTDGEYEFSTILTEEGIANGNYDDSGKFVVRDHEGEEVVVRFFKTQPILLGDIQPR